MDDVFAKTIKMLASDIDSKFNINSNNDDLFETHFFKIRDDFDIIHRHLPPIPVEKPCKCSQQTGSYSCDMNNVDRLRKTASVWFQPKFTRQRVEEILKDFEIGVFIVRLNSANETMVLSYRGEKKVIHIKIKVNAKKGFLVDGSTKIFKNIHALLAYYFLNPIFDPDLKLKLPRILMESTHPSHFKFFENMKSDFWFTQICQLKLSEIFVDSLIDVNFETNLQKKDFQESSLSLPSLKMRYNKNTKQAFTENNKSNLNIFKKVKSKIFKTSTSTPLNKSSETKPNSRRTSLPSYVVPVTGFKNDNDIFGLANDLDNYDYDE